MHISLIPRNVPRNKIGYGVVTVSLTEEELNHLINARKSHSANGCFLLQHKTNYNYFIKVTDDPVDIGDNWYTEE